MELPINQIICGDCLKTIQTFPDESIDMVMFSPPYWGLRDYGVEGQIGLESHPQMYVAHMVEICREVKRVLKKQGSMYIVLGDTYYGGGQGGGGKNEYKGTTEAYPRIAKGHKSSWLQPKQKLLMPSRVAIALQGDSWILRNDIIWHKPNHMPSSVKDRLTNAYEHIFFFAKSRRYYYDLDAIREPHQNKASGNLQRKPNLQPRNSHFGVSIPWTPTQKGKNPGNTIATVDLETAQDLIVEVHQRLDRESPTYSGKNRLPDKNAKRIHAFDGKKIRDAAREILNEKGIPHASKLVEFIHDHFSHPLGKNPADFWSINTKPFKGAHFAVYPKDICLKPIKASCPQQICKKCGKPRTRITDGSERTDTQGWSKAKKQHTTVPVSTIREGKGRLGQYSQKTIGWSKCSCGVGFKPGIVLDPMCGSGTTLVAAQKLGRQWIGIELNPEYVEIAKKRLMKQSQKLSSFSR